MSAAEYDAWMAESAKLEAIYADIHAKAEAHNAEWRQRWPNRCSHCRGWGMFTFVEMHGFKHGCGETMADPCEALPEGVCHRCGAQGLGEDGTGPCSACGWNYDDGEAEP